ncbi:MerC domain-containing protein [Sphingomonas sp. ERG5]|uniref:MerC domain-containing protein n=1 Tax=Sphingomonas sp. ERG5 TaxID=1381597 RepID=UPI0013649045|nr:MerC domain-containing protein [Sphingomonas sp. ERG5]
MTKSKPWRAAIGTARSIDWMERAALFGSVACMVHCLILPLIIAALPALGTVLAIPESFHVWILGFAVPAAALALIQGRARHGERYPLWLGGVGIAWLAIGALVLGGTMAETPVTVVGSLLLAAAHIANWRLRHAAATPCSG